MVATLAITNHITSLAEAEAKFALSASADPNFFTEWQTGLAALSAADQTRLDLIKQRYLYHRRYGHILEGAVNFIVIAPLLELAGLYDPPFHLRSEATVQLDLEDDDGTIYQGRIDSLIIQENLWVLLVEAKRSSFNMTLALPQALTYMAANPQANQPTFALVSNGEYSIFIKLHNGQYSFSDDFSLNRRHNDLHDVLQIIDRLKGPV
jgi:hypothetical protein